MHIYIIYLGLQNDFELLRILNYWSLNYRGSTIRVPSKDFDQTARFVSLATQIVSCED